MYILKKFILIYNFLSFANARNIIIELFRASYAREGVRGGGVVAKLPPHLCTSLHFYIYTDEKNLTADR